MRTGGFRQNYEANNHLEIVHAGKFSHARVGTGNGEKGTRQIMLDRPFFLVNKGVIKRSNLRLALVAGGRAKLTI